MTSSELNTDYKAHKSRIKTLDSKIARFGWLGILFGLLCLVFMFIHSVAVTLKPKEVVAVDDLGQVVGRVVWNDTIVRNSTQIVSDVKRWVAYDLSFNSSSIMEDAQITINHMSKELQEQKIEAWRKNNTLAVIESSGQISNVSFDDDSILIDRRVDDVRIILNATLRVGEGTPKDLRVRVRVNLMPYSENYPLGILIVEHELI